MTNRAERPNEERREKHTDEAGALLKPNTGEGELAVLNPAVHQTTFEGPWPFLYRVRLPTEGGGEHSVIKHQSLLTPTQLDNNPRLLIKPDQDYEIACEDPRLEYADGTYFITYIAFDGLNAVPALATTTDFTGIKKVGLVGPNVPLEEAVNLVNDDGIKRTLMAQLSLARGMQDARGTKGEILPYAKDAAVVFDRVAGGFRLIYRIEPDIQVTDATSNINDFSDKQFWRDQLRQIRQNTSMRAEPDQLKIGIGGVPLEVNGQMISTYHAVVGGPRFLVYQGGLVKFDSSYRAIAKLDDAFLTPDLENDVLIERGPDGARNRKVILFPSAILEDPGKNDRLWVYSNRGDFSVCYRSTSSSWALDALREQDNLIDPKDNFISLISFS